MKLNAWVQTLKFFNLVVRQPKLFEGLTDFIESDNSLDIVATKGKNLKVLKLWQVDNSFNLIC